MVQVKKQDKFLLNVIFLKCYIFIGTIIMQLFASSYLVPYRLCAFAWRLGWMEVSAGKYKSKQKLLRNTTKSLTNVHCLQKCISPFGIDRTTSKHRRHKLQFSSHVRSEFSRQSCLSGPQLVCELQNSLQKFRWQRSVRNLCYNGYFFIDFVCVLEYKRGLINGRYRTIIQIQCKYPVFYRF